MKNREVRVFIASMMLVSLVAGSMDGALLHAPEKGNVTVTEVEFAGAENKETAKTGSETKSSEKKPAEKKALKEVSSETDASASKTSAKPTKEETVYAKIDGSGSVKSVTVSDQLRNISDQSKLEDISDLQDIVNVKGDEAFSSMGKRVVWDTSDADICYQGTTSKELPVGVRISYKLDGKEISAADLKGKSGHVVIRYTYENKSGGSGKASTPFMMATGLILDGENFKNVTVENGRLISDGERNMVIGYGFPSMKHLLGSEEKDLDIPDYFEMEADVTEYEPVEGMTIATNSIFNDLDTDKFDSLDELNDSMGELQDASSQLVSGSGELKNGIDTLLASSGTLTDGINQLVNGGGELQSGTSELADGSNELLDGSHKLADGSQELADGNAKLADGTGQLYDGTRTLADGAGELNLGLRTAAEKTQSVLLPGVNALDDNLGNLQTQLGSALPKLSGAIGQLNEGMNSTGGLRDGAANLETGAGSLKAGADQLVAGIGELQGNLGAVSQLEQGLIQLKAAADSLASGTTTSADTASVQTAENIAANAGALEAQLAAIENSANTPVVISETGGGNAAAESDLDAIASVLAGIVSEDEAVNGAVQSALSYVESARANLYAGGGESVVQNDTSAETIGYAEAAMATAQAIANDANAIIAEGSSSSYANTAAADSIAILQGGTAQMLGEVQAIKGKVSGIDQLVKGAEALQAGAGNLQTGADALKGGIDQVAGGLAELDQEVNQSGMISKVTDGVNQLKNGTAALRDGVGGKDGLAGGLTQLSAGAQKLDAGSTELSEKMGEANEGARTAASGAAKLASGATELSSGATELASGASRLNDGALTLKDGLNTLQSGSGALIDGVQQLDDGAAELNDGMIRFDRDGIQKLVDAFGGDVEDLLDKMNEMLDASRAYKNFSGISDDMDGEVKFIFVTEE